MSSIINNSLQADVLIIDCCLHRLLIFSIDSNLKINILTDMNNNSN